MPDNVLYITPGPLIDYLSAGTTPDVRTSGFGDDPYEVGDKMAVVGALGLSKYLRLCGVTHAIKFTLGGSDGGSDLTIFPNRPGELSVNVKSSKVDLKDPYEEGYLHIKAEEFSGILPDLFWQVYVHDLDLPSQHVHIGPRLRTEGQLFRGLKAFYMTSISGKTVYKFPLSVLSWPNMSVEDTPLLSSQREAYYPLIDEEYDEGNYSGPENTEPVPANH